VRICILNTYGLNSNNCVLLEFTCLASQLAIYLSLLEEIEPNYFTTIWIYHYHLLLYRVNASVHIFLVLFRCRS